MSSSGRHFDAETPGLSGARRWWALGALALMSFMLLLEDTSVSVVLPELRRDLGLSLSGLEWVVNVYKLSVAAVLLPAGKLADVYGRRRIFFIGVATFSAASLLSGTAGSAAVLLSARAMQGVGAAFAAAAALSIISTLFAEGERGKALGIWGGASATGLALGPLVGAALDHLMGWGAVFLVNVPLGIAAIVIARLVIPESRNSGGALYIGSFVPWGAGLFLLLLALTQAPMMGWASAPTLGFFALSLIAFALFLRLESRSRAPLLDLSLFRRASFVGANAVTLLSTAVMCNLFFYLSLYFQVVLGLSALGAGTSLMPLAAMIVVTAPVAGRLADKHGRRAPVVAGMSLLATALFMLSHLDADSTLSATLPGLALAGLGIGLTTSPATAAALDEVSASRAGLGSGVVNTFGMVGLSLGIATMGAMLSAGDTDVLSGGDHAAEAFASGLSNALLMNSVIAFVAAGIAALTIRSRQAQRRTSARHALVRSAQQLLTAAARGGRRLGGASLAAMRSRLRPACDCR